MTWGDVKLAALQTMYSNEAPVLRGTVGGAVGEHDLAAVQAAEARQVVLQGYLVKVLCLGQDQLLRRHHRLVGIGVDLDEEAIDLAAEAAVLIPLYIASVLASTSICHDLRMGRPTDAICWMGVGVP